MRRLDNGGSYVFQDASNGSFLGETQKGSTAASRQASVGVAPPPPAPTANIAPDTFQLPPAPAPAPAPPPPPAPFVPTPVAAPQPAASVTQPPLTDVAAAPTLDGALPDPVSTPTISAPVAADPVAVLPVGADGDRVTNVLSGLSNISQDPTIAMSLLRNLVTTPTAPVAAQPVAAAPLAGPVNDPLNGASSTQALEQALSALQSTGAVGSLTPRYTANRNTQAGADVVPRFKAVDNYWADLERLVGGGGRRTTGSLITPSQSDQESALRNWAALGGQGQTQNHEGHFYDFLATYHPQLFAELSLGELRELQRLADMGLTPGRTGTVGNQGFGGSGNSINRNTPPGYRDKSLPYNPEGIKIRTPNSYYETARIWNRGKPS